MVRPGIVPPWIEKSVDFGHMAQEAIFEAAATQKISAESDHLHRVRIDITSKLHRRHRTAPQDWR